MEVTVKIPDGDYCGGCKLLHRYCNKLVDMMGNETGNTREGYECKLHDMYLEVEKTECGMKQAKKCYFCNMSDTQRTLMGLLFLVMAKQWGKNDDGEEGKKDAPLS